MNGVDAAEELRRDILPALVGPNRMGTERVAISLLARSMNVLNRSANGEPFPAEAPAGLCMQPAVHLSLRRWPMAVALAFPSAWG